MRILLGLLPYFDFFAAVLVLHVVAGRRKGEAPSLLESIMQASAVFGLWVVLGTETYSKLGILYFWPILLWWVAPGVACVFYLLRHRGEIRIAWRLRWPTILEWTILLPLVFLLVAAFLAATFCPPNNYDSYSYHLPRQIFWMQAGNVREYPTNNLRQVMMAPYSEFVGVNIMTLSNSDRLLNLTQFSALVLSLIPVALLTKRVGGKPIAQLLACLLVVAMPVAFIEASNTKNDLVVALWILISAWWLVRLIDGWRMSWFDAILLGGTIGCAADTKGTGPLFVITLVVVLSLVMLVRRTRRDVALLAVIALVSLSVNLPQYARNIKNFGHPNGPTVAEGDYPLYLLSHKPGPVISNILRGFVWHATIPYEPFNDWMYSEMVWLHNNVLQIGINDPITTTPYSNYSGLRFHGGDEDRAEAPVHVLLFLLLPVTLLLARKRVAVRISLLLVFLSVAGFVIFCSAVKWEEWHVRYYIVLAALMCPVFAATLTGRFAWISAPVVAALALVIVAPMTYRGARPIFGSGNIFQKDELTNRLVYIGHPDDVLEMVEIAANHNVKWVGLATDGDHPDYLYMELLRKRLTTSPQFQYVEPYVKIKGIPTHRSDMIIAQPDTTSMRDPVTRTQYVLYRSYTKFNLLLPDTDTTQDNYPAFFGWFGHDGMAEVEGPYPQWQLPRVRWGIYPQTHVQTDSPAGGVYDLYLLMRRNDDPKQTIRIEINGELVATHPFSARFEFEPLRLKLTLHPGKNDIVFRYGSGDKNNLFARGVLFQTFQITPARAASAGTMPAATAPQ